MTDYRADIDGLRAVAVLPVVLFHAGLPGVGGGFVGVDVFFVISGYLITRIMVGDLRADRFSIATFYERRIRRIFPALVVVLAATTAAAVFVLLPGDLEEYGRSLAAIAVFASNIFFWNSTGYFTADAHAKPLLHTWSLAVEEQFYLFFPILLIAVHRWFAQRWAFSLTAIALVSFGIAVWAVESHPSAAFYLLPSRAWELCLGALVAVGAFPRFHRAAARETAAAVGMAAIAIAVTQYDASTPFPGIAALLPCVGAALIIHAGADGSSLVGRALAARPLVAIGLASYSLYLWHWPLIALAARYSTADPSLAAKLSLVTIALLLSWISLEVIETPFRRGPVEHRTRVLWSGAAVIVLVFVAGSTFALNEGFAARLRPDVLAFERGRLDSSPERVRCHADHGKRIAYVESCVLGRPGVSPHILLWGDSHAMEYASALRDVADAQGHAFRLASFSGCAPMYSSPHAEQAPCVEHNAEIRRALLNDTTLTSVILVARYSLHLEKEGAQFLEEFARIAEEIRSTGRRVVIIEPIPEYPFEVPLRLARTLQGDGDVSTVGMPRAEFDAASAPTRRRLQAIAGVHLVAPADILCEAGWCRTAEGGRSLYFDDDHLSMHGARVVVTRLALQLLLDPIPSRR